MNLKHENMFWNKDQFGRLLAIGMYRTEDGFNISHIKISKSKDGGYITAMGQNRKVLDKNGNEVIDPITRKAKWEELRTSQPAEWAYFRNFLIKSYEIWAGIRSEEPIAVRQEDNSSPEEKQKVWDKYIDGTGQTKEKELEKNSIDFDKLFEVGS